MCPLRPTWREQDLSPRAEGTQDRGRLLGNQTGTCMCSGLQHAWLQALRRSMCSYFVRRSLSSAKAPQVDRLAAGLFCEDLHEKQADEEGRDSQSSSLRMGCRRLMSLLPGELPEGCPRSPRRHPQASDRRRETAGLAIRHQAVIHHYSVVFTDQCIIFATCIRYICWMRANNGRKPFDSCCKCEWHTPCFVGISDRNSSSRMMPWHS